ncbi:MAG: arsenate reductase (glutaredoxin) [Litorimonas sp.]
MLTIWHNPRCMKSRQTLALIEAAGVDFKIRKYLDEVPSADEVMTILAQLDLEDPRSLMRRGESVYKELKLKTESSGVKLVQAMADHPILIERPIVTNGVRAVIGRPPEAVKALL